MSDRLTHLKRMICLTALVFLASLNEAATAGLIGVGDFSGNETVIDYDNLAGGEIITNQFAGLGVIYDTINGSTDADVFRGSLFDNGSLPNAAFVELGSGGFLRLSYGTLQTRVGTQFITSSSEELIMDVFGDSGFLETVSVSGSQNSHAVLEGFIGVENTAGISSVEIRSSTNGFNFAIDDTRFEVFPEPTTLILLDIKPGSFPNSVNLNSKGVLPVAILGTEDFDVNSVDQSADILLFSGPLPINGGGSPVSPIRSAFEDVNVDGFMDLTLKFSIAEMVKQGALVPDTIEGILIGLLKDGTSITGMDSIRIVPPNGSNGNSLLTSAVPEPKTSALSLAALCLAMSRRRSF